MKARKVCNTISQNLCQEMQSCFSASFLLITSQNFYLFRGRQSFHCCPCRHFCPSCHCCHCCHCCLFCKGSLNRQGAAAVLSLICDTIKMFQRPNFVQDFANNPVRFVVFVSIEFNFEKKLFCLVSSFNWPGPILCSISNELLHNNPVSQKFCT